MLNALAAAFLVASHRRRSWALPLHHGRRAAL